MHIAPRRHCAGPRGAATWPCMPRRIHAGPALNIKFFLFLYYLKPLKIENKIKENLEKFPKNRKFITFDI